MSATVRTHRRLLALAMVGTLLFVVPVTIHAQGNAAAVLTDEQAALLTEIDPAAAAEILAFADKVQKWRQEFERIRQLADKAKEVKERQVVDAARAALLQEVVQLSGKVQTKLRKQFPVLQEIEDAVKAADKAWKDVPFDPNNPDKLDENGFRDKLKATAYAKVSQAIQQLIDAKLLQQVARLKNPAQFAQDFLENEIKKRYLNKPVTFNQVKFTLTQKDFTKSFFAADANLAIEIEYSTVSQKVTLTGLYFRHVKGKAPEPVFDRIKGPDRNALLESMKSWGLTKIGEELPDLGLPLQIKSPEFIDFSPTHGDRRGSLSFKVALQLDKLADAGMDKVPILEGNVTLHHNGKVEVGALQLDFPVNPPIALGTTGLFFERGRLILNPKDKTETITIGATLSTAAGGGETLLLDGQISFGFPITKTGVKFKGKMMVGRQVLLGEAWGEITREHMTINVSASLQGGVTKLTAKGEINKQGLTASGTLDSLLGASQVKTDVFIGSNGHGFFSISEGFDIGSAAKAQVSLAGSFTPGFKKVTLNGGLCVQVKDDLLSWVEAVVEVEAELAPKPQIRASAQVGSVSVGPLECADFRKLYKELQGALGKKRDQLYDWLADREKTAGKWAGEREKVLERAIYEHAKAAGLDKVKTGNPKLDKALGDVADSLKGGRDHAVEEIQALGGKAADARKEAEKWLAHPDVPQPPAHASIGGHKLWSFELTEAAAPPGRIGKVFGMAGGFDHLADSVHDSVHNLHQEVYHRAEINQRLQALQTAVDRINIHKKQHARSGEVSELRVRIDRVLSHPVGSRDAALSFLIQTSSFRYTINGKDHQVSKPVRASQAYVADIQIKGLFGKNRAKADLNLPKLANASPWDVENLLRDELSEVIEKHLPKTDLAGRFEERKLSLRNATSEPLTVFVQFQTRVGGRWAWQPAGPGLDKSAVRVVVPVGKTVEVQGMENGALLHGQRVRFWAESESGRMWTKYAREDLVLVDEKDDDGEYRYYDDAMQFFLFTFTASRGQRTFRERVVMVRNDTSVPLLVNAQALSVDPGGKPDWDGLLKPFKVDPGRTVKLRQGNGWYLRGSEVKLWAEDEKGEHFRWTKYKQETIRQVDKDGYRLDTIGAALYVLEAPGATLDKPNPAGADATVWTRQWLPDQVKVPAVKGLSLQKARAELTRFGLRGGAEKGAAADDVVATQNPTAGWQSPTTEVQLTTAVAVPVVAKLTLAQARKKLEASGLQASTVQPAGKTVSYSADDLVVAQDPPPSTEQKASILARGQAVKLTVAIKVPAVTGLTVAEAVKKLREHNLRPEVSTGVPDTLKVAKQKPAAEAHAELDSLVHLELQLVVPDLVNHTPEQASALATKAGLRVKWEAKPVEDERVIRQSLKAGAGSEANAEVILTAGPVVPRVVGLDVEAAKVRLKQKGLDFRTGTAQNKESADPKLAGKTIVTEQSVENKAVARGTAVLLELTHYAEAKVIVPDVTGRSLAEARKLLEERRLVVKTVNPAEGLVKSQKPPAGSMAKRGDEVVLTFAPVVPKIKVPDLRTMRADEARTAVAQGFEFVGVYDGMVLNKPNTERLAKLQVARQEPAPGTLVEAGSKITCTLQDLPKPPPAQVAIPDVTGKTQVQAQKMLEALGLIVKTLNDPKNGPATGTKPAAGTKVAPGETVIVIFPPKPAVGK